MTAAGRRPIAVVMGAAFAARLPYVMVSLVMVLLLRAAGYGYGAVGVVVAAYVVTTGIASPLVGRVADRVGAPPVLLASGVSCSAGLAVMALFTRELGTGGLVAVAAVTGAVAPPITAVLRAAIPGLVPPEARTTVYGLEAALQEILFVVGPLLVVLAVALFDARAAMLMVAGLLTALVTVFAAVVRARSVPAERGHGWAMRSSDLRRLVVVYGLLGLCFGSAELAIIAVLDDHGHRELSGALIACWAGGSLIGGLVVARRSRRPPHLRLPSLLIALTALTVPLALMSVEPALLAGGLLLQGVVIAPALGTIYEMVPDVAPDGLLTEAFGWGSSFVYAGVAAGNAAAGALAGPTGPASGFVIAVIAPLLALPVARSLRRTVRHRIAAGG